MRIRQLRRHADIARMDLGGRLLILAARIVELPDALLFAPRAVQHRRAALQYARHHAEIVQRSQKRIGDGLENQHGQRRGIGGLPLFFRAGLRVIAVDMLDFDRVRELMDDDVQQVGHPDIFSRGTTQDGNDFACVNAFMQAAHHLIVGQRLAVQKLFDQLVVAFRCRIRPAVRDSAAPPPGSPAGSPSTPRLCQCR